MLKDKRIMMPLWIAYPEIDRYSIGWRMGYGEDYVYQWGTWFDSLTEEDAKAIRSFFQSR